VPDQGATFAKSRKESFQAVPFTPFTQAVPFTPLHPFTPGWKKVLHGGLVEAGLLRPA